VLCRRRRRHYIWRRSTAGYPSVALSSRWRRTQTLLMWCVPWTCIARQSKIAQYYFASRTLIYRHGEEVHVITWSHCPPSFFPHNVENRGQKTSYVLWLRVALGTWIQASRPATVEIIDLLHIHEKTRSL